MPPPNRNPSKKREREDSEHQGGNEEKKGRSVQSQVPQALTVRTLTRWSVRTRPKSIKLKAVHDAKNAFEVVEKQKGKADPIKLDNSMVHQYMTDRAEELDVDLPSGPTSDPVSAWEAARKTTRRMAEHLGNDNFLYADLAEKSVAQNTANSLPEDFGSGFSAYRMQLRPFIAGLVRYPQYQFSQGQQPQVAQTLLKFNVGGLCAALCLEYIHWRRANYSPARILGLFRKDATQDRMGWTQKKGYEERAKLKNIESYGEPYPARDSLFSASLLADMWINLGKAYTTPFNDLHVRLLQSPDYPLSVRKKRLDYVGRVPRFDFSMETLEALRPHGRANIPIMTRFAVPTSRPASRIDASSSSSSSSIFVWAQFCLSTSNAADEQQSDSELIRLIKSDFKQYQSDFQLLRHLIATNVEEPYVMMCLYMAHEIPPTTVTGRAGGHAIILDLSRDGAGIFDPNIGFLPLGSGSNPAMDMCELYWLLGLLFVCYDVRSIAFYTLK